MHKVLQTVLLFSGCFCTVLLACFHPEEIRCRRHNKCIKLSSLCDGNFDCVDLSDEDPRLCRAWINKDCQRSFVRCHPFDGCLPIFHYCDFAHSFCESNIDLRICKMILDKVLQDIDSVDLDSPLVTTNEEEVIDFFKGMMSSTIFHEDCPLMFTKIGDQCVSILFMSEMNWFESRAFCQTLGGDLLTINRDFGNLNTIIQHLQENLLTKDFWIGGILREEMYGWQWVDDTDMKLGSPLWAVRYTSECLERGLPSKVLNDTQVSSDYCYFYKQAPAVTPEKRCAAMTYEQYHYVSDEDCMRKKSPLCVAT